MASADERSGFHGDSALAARVLNPGQILRGAQRTDQVGGEFGGFRLLTRFDQDALALAADIELQPQRYFRRHVERIDITKQRLLHSTVQELSIPTDFALDRCILIPVSSGVKGVLLDDSHVSSSSGYVRRLTSDEELEFEQFLLVAAYERVFESADLGQAQLRGYYTHLSAIEAIPFSEPAAGTVAIQKFLDWLSSVPYLPNPTKVERLVGLAQLFSERFIKCVELQNITSRDIVLSRTTDSISSSIAGGIEKPANFVDPRPALKRIMGRRSYRVSIDIADVTRAASFHVFIDSPPGHHIHEQEIQLLAPRVITSEGAAGDASSVAMIPNGFYRASPIGSDQAHIYFNPQVPLVRKYFEGRGVRHIVRLAEDLPGTLLPALIPGLLLAFISVVTTLYAENNLPDNATSAASLSSAFPAFFLALPGVASLVFRPQDNSAVVNAPLVSAIAPFVYATSAFVLGGVYFTEVINPRSDHRVFFLTAVPTTALLVAFVIYLACRVVLKIRSEIPECRGLDRNAR